MRDSNAKILLVSCIKFSLNMPLLKKLFSSRNSMKNHSECRLLVNFGIGANNDRRGIYFGADQVRILLFRECEWRGRKLLFDSVSARKSSNAAVNLPCENNAKRTNDGCAKSEAAVVGEHEKVECDDVSLLSEMVFGTVAMTYRGSMFKIHALNTPKCLMCTKVFPAPDHTPHKISDRLSDDTLGTAATGDSNSSGNSIKNSSSHLCSPNVSGNSLTPELRKNSTCSSTSSGWDIEIPLLGSSQSLESSCSSGFGSLTSLRRRWLRAISTTLSHSELDDTFGIQGYNDSTGSEARDNYRRHKTRLGLAVLVQLTPGRERQMEARLLEHAGQLEAMLNRLCYASIESCRTHGKSNGVCKGLTSRLHRASNRCISWLVRLFSDIEINSIPSLWHEVIMNTTSPVIQRTHILDRTLQQMCQLINAVDTKSTNFFLSTVVTAVLTHHLGWVHTVMSSRDKELMENLSKRYPCNPLWAQLGDLYGVLGNPPKLVHTVVAGDGEKTSIMNAVLTFLSYFIRSAIIEKRREFRCPSQQDVQEAITILERMKRRKIERFPKSTKIFENSRATCEESSKSQKNESSSSIHWTASKSAIPTTASDTSIEKLNKRSSIDLSIPRLKRTHCTQTNLNVQSSNFTESKMKHPAKVESFDCVDASSETPLVPDLAEKNYPTSTVKIIVSETNSSSDLGATKGILPRVNQDFDHKGFELGDTDMEEITMEVKLSSLRRHNDSGFESQKFHHAFPIETETFHARLELPKENQQSQVFFTLGDETKPFDQQSKQPQPIDCSCQCSFAFTRVPSTSADLPEGVLRKIIQRNFPESSRSIQSSSSSSLRRARRLIDSCPKCNGAGYSAAQGLERSKLLLETPTNATEVLRTCGTSIGNRATRLLRSNSLEALMEANGVVELPMPRSKKSVPNVTEPNEVSGFTKTLLQRRVTNNEDSTSDSTIYDSGYTSGLVMQGLTRKKRRKEKVEDSHEKNDSVISAEWLSQLREEVTINAKFPVIDQPVSEALCILADLDNWQVGVLSNNSTAQSPLVQVGMSRLVATMLESFSYLWTKYRSPRHCIGIFECKLREMWLRSEALAEMLMAVDVCDVSIASLTKALDLDAADIPLLLAVATTHSPQIAQRFGLSLA